MPREEDFRLCRPWNPKAIGIAVIRLQSGEKAAQAVMALKEYLFGVKRVRRVQACHGSLTLDALAVFHGTCAMVLLCPDPAPALKALKQGLSDGS